jgi:COMPASS component SWD2
MSTNEGSIHLIDALKGEESKKLYAKTNGIGKIKYTHHESCIIMTAEKGIDVKYLSLHDNRYIRYFRGHTDKVTSISMSPVDDHFISSSLDKNIFLWDLASPNAVGKLALPNYCEKSSVCFDESGVVFGVICQNSINKKQHLKLFDARNYEVGPFQDLAPDSTTLSNSIRKAFPLISDNLVSKAVQNPWNTLEFSSDGNHILINTLSDYLLVLDGFRSDVEPVAIPRKNDAMLPLGACFSSNAKYVIIGNDENELLIYDKQNLELKNTLLGHVSPVGCVRCNPKYDEIASGCGNTVLWIPSLI